MHAEEKRNPLIYLFAKTWRYSAGNRRNIVWFWTMFIVAHSTTLFAMPLIQAYLLNVVTTTGINKDNWMKIILLLMSTLLLRIFFWSLHGPGRVLEMSNAFKARLNYRKHLLKGIMGLPMEWHVEHHSGDTIDKIEKGTSALFKFSQDSFEIIYTLVQLTVSYIMLAYFSPPSSVIVLMMLLVCVLITMRFDKVLIGQYKQLNHAENNVAESVFDTISNISTVIILRVERLIFKSIIGLAEKPYGLFRRNNILNEIKWFLTSMCCAVMTIVVLGVYFHGHMEAATGILAGNVYLLLSYLDRISDTFFMFTGKYGDILQWKAKVMNAEELTVDFKSENMTNHVLPLDWNRLNISGLRFSYCDSKAKMTHLCDIDMEILKGQRIAFVGQTGSGKSTLLMMIRDLYRPQEMTLRVDGKDLPQGFSMISQAIALVPQKADIFTSTIRENITMHAEHDERTIERVVRLACLNEVISKLPNKMESSIKERGVNLSVGQQQLLAFARGLLACLDKEIILFDEPTSSLDPGTEYTIYQNIFREFKKKTIISALHKMHLLPLFDVIYFFHKGKIVGHGTLQQLLESCPQFKAMWEKGLTANAEENTANSLSV